MKEIFREFGKAGLYGLAALAMVGLWFVLATMSRLEVLVVIQFVLLAVLAVWVWCLSCRLRDMERLLDIKENGKGERDA